MELPLSYLKELATQIIFISAFLGGFSAAILGTLITSKNNNKMLKMMILGTSISAISFIVAVFAMTQIVMITIPGYPGEVVLKDTIFPKTIGSLAFFAGIIALIFVVSSSGWVHSKRLGIFTTIIGVVGFILIILTSTRFG